MNESPNYLTVQTGVKTLPLAQTLDTKYLSLYSQNYEAALLVAVKRRRWQCRVCRCCNAEFCSEVAVRMCAPHYVFSDQLHEQCVVIYYEYYLVHSPNPDL